MEIKSKAGLQRALNKLTQAQTEAFKLHSCIAEYCREEYGYTPGDVDNDEFIDSVGGGAGVCIGMTAEEFHKSMTYCIDQFKNYKGDQKWKQS